MNIVIAIIDRAWIKRSIKEAEQLKVAVRADGDAGLPRILLIHDPAFCKWIVLNLLNGLRADELFDIFMHKLYLLIQGWHQKELGQIDAHVSEGPLVHDLPLLDRGVHEVTAEEKQELGIEQLFGCLLNDDTKFEGIDLLLLAVNSFDRCLYSTVFKDNFAGH